MYCIVYFLGNQKYILWYDINVNQRLQNTGTA